MKRLSAQIGITLFSAMAVAFYLPENVKFAVIILALAVTAVFLCVSRFRSTVWLPGVSLTVFIAVAVNIGYTYLHVIPIQESFSGNNMTIEATLTEEEYRSYSKYYYQLNADKINGRRADTKVLLTTAHSIDIEPFDHIVFMADTSPTQNNYYLAKGYYLTVNTYDSEFIVTEAESRPLYYHAIELRRLLREALDKYLPDDVASLCKAVLIGDKYALSSDVKDSFRYAGASYFIVVSGMHFAVICMLIFALFKKLRVNRFVQLAISLSVILIYMAVTGFQPSVVRSGIMILTLVISRAIRRINSSHSSLGIAGVLLPLIFTPYGVGDIGMVLSYAATFGIITFYSPIKKRLSFKSSYNVIKRAYNAVISVLSVSLAANILVFPISVFVFNGFSTVTLLSSLVLYLPIELILIVSLIVCIFFYLGPLSFISMLGSWILYAVGKIVLWIIFVLSSLPFSYVRIGAAYVYIWTAAAIVLGVISLALRKRYRMYNIAALLSAVVLLSGMIIHTVITLNTVELNVFQCGNGMAVGLDYHGSLYMLSFDAKSYDAYDLVKELSYDYGSAELAVCGRGTEYKNYMKLSDREFAISRILMYDNDIADSSGITMLTDGTPCDYWIADDVLLTVTPYKGKLMSYLTVGDTDIVILPYKYQLKGIPDAQRSADIIIVSDSAKDYETLRCGRLIISSEYSEADRISSAMSIVSGNISSTADGAVTIDLR